MAIFQFQIEINNLNAEIIGLIPSHREFINQLFFEGKILTYSVSENKKNIWCTVFSESKHEALDLIAEMPLSHYFTDIQCHALLFHNMMSTELPDISLN